MYMPTNPSKRAKTADDEDGIAIPLPRLSDQVSVSTARHKDLDGTALWVLLTVYRAFATLDRDQSDEVAAMGLTPLQFNILTTLQHPHHPSTCSSADNDGRVGGHVGGQAQQYVGQHFFIGQ